MKAMRRLATCAAAGLLAFATTLPAKARDAFEVDLSAANQTGSRGFSSLENAIGTLGNTSALQSLVPGYTDTSAAIATVDLRGLGASATFAANSTALTLIIPSAGINQTFTGATRADSATLMERFLEGRGATSNLFRSLAANTPTDPVAGNPNSLMNQMVSSDFSRAMIDATGSSPSGFGLDARYGTFSASGFNSQSVSLPLDYSWRLSERDAIELDVPLAITDTGGGKSYSGNFGVLLRHRVLPNWTLQPSVRIGGAGSVDLGSAAAVWSVAVNSTFKFDLPAGWQLAVANGLTYISTIPVSVGNLTLDYNLSNTVFRNGLVASHDLGFRMLNLPMRASVFAIDTRFTGDAVYMRSYQEFGLFASAGSLSPVRLGVAYLSGDHGIHGFSVSTGVNF